MRYVVVQLVDFFRTVVTGEEGYFCLATAKISDDEETTYKSWKEDFYVWPTELPEIIDSVARHSKTHNVYFSPYLFDKKSSKKVDVIVGSTIASDLDEANVLTINPKPTILVETSEGRHQGYWVLKNAVEKEDHEQLSRKLTYSIPRADRNGWFVGKKLRVPQTQNFKYKTGPQYVRIVENAGIKYDYRILEALPSVNELYKGDILDNAESDLEWVKEALSIEIGPQELLASVRAALPARVYAQYNVLAPDRSATLWALMCAAFRVGLDRAKVFHLAHHSVNNKFNDLRYGSLTALAKDVLRAELSTKIQLPDTKSKIAEARHRVSNATERNTYISKLVIEQMQKMGSFINASDGSMWFIRDDTGFPINITPRSEEFEALMYTIFGINGSETEYRFTVRAVMAHIKGQFETGLVGRMCLFDEETNTFMLHSGRKDVLTVTKDGISRVQNGYNSIVFPWSVGRNLIQPKYQSLSQDWADELFDGCFDNVIGIPPKQVQAIIKVWLLSVLLRDAIVARPILALLGMPGSGKSTLFRRIYAVLYGATRSLNAVTTENDFDQAMVLEPVVILDNVDTYARWLPDRMALAASKSEVLRRKLYTDTETVQLTRNAMLGITAHNPKFIREDITDRMLLFTFERLENFLPEAEIIGRIVKLRNAIWGAILTDIQTVFNTPMPTSGYPQFRIEDFARFGYWIATALNIGPEFHAGISSIRKDQRLFSLDEDSMLLDALNKVIDADIRRNTPSKVRLAGEWYVALEATFTSREQIQEFNKKYRNGVALGKKFWTLNDAMKVIYDVKIEYDTVRGSRKWSFSKKEVESAAS